MPALDPNTTTNEQLVDACRKIRDAWISWREFAVALDVDETDLDYWISVVSLISERLEI